VLCTRAPRCSAAHAPTSCRPELRPKACVAAPALVTLSATRVAGAVPQATVQRVFGKAHDGRAGAVALKPVTPATRCRRWSRRRPQRPAGRCGWRCRDPGPGTSARPPLPTLRATLPARPMKTHVRAQVCTGRTREARARSSEAVSRPLRAAPPPSVRPVRPEIKFEPEHPT
jgi:hypothetical protein